MHEAMALVFAPTRVAARAIKQASENSLHPLAYASPAPILIAGCEIFERATRGYDKSDFGLGVVERIV